MQAWTQVATETIALLRIAHCSTQKCVRYKANLELFKCENESNTLITCQLCKELQSARARYGNFSFTGSETFRGLPFHELITLDFSLSNLYNK